MTELLTAEEINTIKTIGRFESWISHGFDLLKIARTIEAQQAQIKGLAEALKDLRDDFFAEAMDACRGWAVEAEEALGSLPREWLEREQKREAVIQAAVALMSDASGELDGVMHPLEMALDDAVAELQALEK